MPYSLSKRCVAEGIGTFWLVFAGCGSAVISAAFPNLGIGFLGVALAFGLTVVTGAYAFGQISGAHFNPAITTGMVVARKMPGREWLPYIFSQLIGAIVAAIFLYFIAVGKPNFILAQGFAANGFGEHSPGGYTLGACLLTELILTFMFVLVILGVTGKDALKSFAPLTIGLTLTLVHLFSIPVTNASVNPARSTGPALILGGWALQQLWLFWVAPLIGAVLAGSFYSVMNFERAEAEEPVPAKGILTPTPNPSV